MDPRNGRPFISGLSRCRPVPASSTSVGGPSSRDSATQEVFPPYRTKAPPGEGVDPRTPQIKTRTRRVYVSSRRWHLANLRLGATSHDLGGELPLERALNLGYKSRRVFSTPGGALAEDVPRPFVEIRDGDLVDQPAGGVVDPMAREGAGAQDLVAGRAIRLEVQCQCRPDDRRDDLDKRGTVQLAGQRDRRTAARGLDEPN